LININPSNLLSVKRHPSGLNIRPVTLKILLLVITKLLTISCNCGLRLSASQYSITQFLIYNEANSDANIDAHLTIGQKSIVKKTLVSLRFLPVSSGSRWTR